VTGSAFARTALARDRDLPDLLAVDVALVPRERQEAIVRASVSAGTCIAARQGDRLAGFVTWDRGFFDRPFVRLLAIGSAHRRGGLGRMLLRAVEEAVAASGAHELFVSTEAINAPMQALLASERYAPSGSIDNLNEPGNAELVYYKRL
jgi:GNAT superfamily N-acetyltransferase